MPMRNAIASVAVKDVKPASQWYARLFGRPADSTPMSEVAEWKFDGGDGCSFISFRSGLAEGP